ncbi:hypothetical protein [Actinophytocola oryzae]|uniref:hypothetical protein n=1 Tax=Actinophytocola oryzae TaxID=502181 RepID=UPI0014152E4E|nr:hypothetical protein [Actinophytocola oryzae]
MAATRGLPALRVEPGDESATPRQGVAGCPFVDLPGRRLFTVIDGEVTHTSTVNNPGPS